MRVTKIYGAPKPELASLFTLSLVEMIDLIQWLIHCVVHNDSSSRLTQNPSKAICIELKLELELQVLKACLAKLCLLQCEIRILRMDLICKKYGGGSIEHRISIQVYHSKGTLLVNTPVRFYSLKIQI